MYALKRILAYGIDMALITVLGWIGYFLLVGFTAASGTASVDYQQNEMMLGISSMLLSGAGIGAPILLFGILEGALGWTPGKLILSLRVQKRGNQDKIGIAQGILRQMIKTFAISFMFFGALWALYGIITSNEAFYDNWLRIDVNDLKPFGLTDTQKNWRKHMQG